MVFMPEFHIASRPMDRLMRSCKAQWFDFATLTNSPDRSGRPDDANQRLGGGHHEQEIQTADIEQSFEADKAPSAICWKR